MNCFVATTEQLFDPSLFTVIPRRAPAFKVDDPPPSLFDIPAQNPRWRQIDRPYRFEEDAERWDGLA